MRLVDGDRPSGLVFEGGLLAGAVGADVVVVEEVAVEVGGEEVAVELAAVEVGGEEVAVEVALRDFFFGEEVREREKEK